MRRSSRLALTTASARYVRPTITYNTTRYYSISVGGNTYADKQKAAENQYVLQREKELLDRLRAKGLNEQQANAVKDEIHEAAAAPPQAPAPTTQARPDFYASQTSDDYITHEEFHSFRRDIINKLRALEDEVLQIKVEQKKKKPSSTFSF
eukprot:TRINITY_DN6455_c0_g1_i1.p1 TRINITY_DN6455_c0_g1~~TRINITY_DN6455_c0_g1_i1.p1  ORF type:complete len:168 (-),score=49.91 TRINITY_DN6455_c0_g1_i1:39-491(-)